CLGFWRDQADCFTALPRSGYLNALIRRKEDTRLDAERLVQQQAGWADEDRPRSVGSIKARDARVPAIFGRHFDEESQIRPAGFGSQRGWPVPVHRRHEPGIPESIAAAFREMLERSAHPDVMRARRVTRRQPDLE